MKRDRSFRILDVAIILAVAAIAVVMGFRIYGNRTGSVHLVVEAPGGSWIYKLDTDRTVTIPGALGPTVIKIEQNSARIIESACPNKTCVAAAPISKKGEWNACLPNKVIIRVADDTAGADELDATGY
jgi:Uncharacterized protein conserved in bacteria